MKFQTQPRYGIVARFFHWSMAALILWQFLKFFDRINDGEHWVGENLVPWHVSIGALLLVLVVLRAIWAFKQRGTIPPVNPQFAPLVTLGPLMLYAVMLVLPLTGIMIMLGNGYGLSPFGIQLVERGTEISWMATLGSWHSPLAWLLLVLVIGHVGIALVHHFILKDNTLKRML